MHLIDPFEFRRMFAGAHSLAVIGNAPTILEHPNGELIDSHDLVVRFNRATTAGYEAHVGQRTDILVVNASNSKKLGAPPSETVRPQCLVSFVSTQGVPSLDYDSFAEWVGELPLLLVFGPDLIGIDARMRTRPLTSGTYFLYMAPRLLTIEKMFVTGFTMFGAVAGGSGKFYADFRSGVGTFHDLDAEEPIFANLLGAFGGKLETTSEVAEIMRRNSVSRGMGQRMENGNGNRSSFAQRIAGALSWRLMGAAMGLRRIAEKSR